MQEKELIIANIVAASVVRQCHDKLERGAGAPDENDMKSYHEEAISIAELWQESQPDVIVPATDTESKLLEKLKRAESKVEELSKEIEKLQHDHKNELARAWDKGLVIGHLLRSRTASEEKFINRRHDNPYSGEYPR